MLAQFGPMASTRQERLAEANRQTGRLRSRYGAGLLAVALHGEVARNADGPYSAIDMYCVVAADGIERSEEWTADQCSGTTSHLGLAVARQLAAEVGADWALRQGRFRYAVCIDGDAGLVEELSQAVLAAPATEFQNASRDLVNMRLRPVLATLRNARAERRWGAVPAAVVEFTSLVALLLGLTHRHCYGSAARMWEESRRFESLPDGYEELLRAVTTGSLRDPEKTIAMAERLWTGVVDAFPALARSAVRGDPE